MDRNQQISYEKDFRIKFLESKGDAFQNLFETLMTKLYPGDFMACRPWGKVGDRKNDGYLPSKRTLFQVYAPNELNTTTAIKKINEDFIGAKEHWKNYFDKWVFVHNTSDGKLPPHVIGELIKLGDNHPEIKNSHWGWEELRIEFRKLDLVALESWFGYAMTSADQVNLGFSDLEAVLQHIVISPGVTPSETKDVPSGKIEFNSLSSAVASFLKIGMEKAPLVEDFFGRWKTPIYGTQIASAFKKRYIELSQESPTLHPDEIFGRLEKWAGGASNTSPSRKVAVLAVLAYLFDSCEIFEEPKE